MTIRTSTQIIEDVLMTKSPAQLAKFLKVQPEEMQVFMQEIYMPAMLNLHGCPLPSADNSELQEEIAELQEEIAELQQEIANLRRENIDMRETVELIKKEGASKEILEELEMLREMCDQYEHENHLAEEEAAEVTAAGYEDPIVPTAPVVAAVEEPEEENPFMEKNDAIAIAEEKGIRTEVEEVIVPDEVRFAAKTPIPTANIIVMPTEPTEDFDPFAPEEDMFQFTNTHRIYPTPPVEDDDLPF